jgi:predicted outer membrane repeat protein
MTVSDSTISNNTATLEGGGGIFAGGTLTVERSTISGNTSDTTGGGIHSQTFDPTTQKPTIANSTISGNTAGEYGGGLYNYVGIIEIEHSTITNNSAPTNQGSGVASSGVSDTTHTDVFSSIISANANTDVDFVRGADTSFFVSKGYNLIGDGNATDAFNQSGDRKGADDPGLAPLMLNAPGSTKTHALKSTSPALDAGPPSTTQCPPPATDQRGVSRPQQGGCDIGSFEREDATAPQVSAATPTGTGIGRGTNVVATFSEAMDAATINKTTFRLFKVTSTGTTQVTNVTVTPSSDGLKATLNPFGTSTTLLARNTKYRAVVTTGARDVAGNALDQNSTRAGNQQKAWTFTTRG